MNSINPKLFLVGGAVRDLYILKGWGLSLEEIKAAVNDFDFVVEAADFDSLVKLSKDAGFTPVPNANTDSGFVEFPEHLGIKAYDPVLNCVVDIHCARKEFDYRDRRHPAIVISGTIQEDVERRDFTCNGLLLEREKYLSEDWCDLDIIDFVGGLDCIDSGILKTIGKATDRFLENPDRVIRLFRFAIKYDWKFDCDILKALYNYKVLNAVRQENDDVKVKSLNKILRNHNHLVRFLDMMSDDKFVSDAIFSNVGLMATNRSDFLK
jgi:tRNA nucleotidyltransferase/poly(A) polymerase